MEELLNKISKLLIQADSKSEELMIGDFKQYYDEEFSPAMWELLDKWLHKKLIKMQHI